MVWIVSYDNPNKGRTKHYAVNYVTVFCTLNIKKKKLNHLVNYF